MNIEDRVDCLEGRVNEMDKSDAKLEQVTKQFLEQLDKANTVLDRLDGTLKEVQLSMVQMQSEIKSNSEKVDALESKVNNIEDKGKFDWLVFIKKDAIPFLLGSGVLFAILKISGAL